VAVPFYLYQLAYSSEAIKGLVATPSDRKAAAAKLAESMGGKPHEFFFCFGEYDVVCVVEAPSDAAWAAAALTVSSAGTVSKAVTTKLLTVEEAMEAMRTAGKVSGAYRPPMS
jgi:uncharacterized protein with GYD domain